MQELQKIADAVASTEKNLPIEQNPFFPISGWL